MAGKRSNIPLFLGVATAVGGGYYYYSASGGNVNKAQAKFEGDTAKARENAQATYDSLKASATSATDLGKHKLDEAQARLDTERKKAQSEIQSKIDEADKKIQDGAAKAKGWFGRS